MDFEAFCAEPNGVSSLEGGIGWDLVQAELLVFTDLAMTRLLINNVDTAVGGDFKEFIKAANGKRKITANKMSLVAVLHSGIDSSQISVSNDHRL